MAKVNLIKDLFGILVTVIVYVINHVMLKNICKCRNKSVEEFSENTEGNKEIYNGTD